jgi:ferredoxin
MAFVITRLCRDCVDGVCVDVCPVGCILEQRADASATPLPRQLFIDPEECIHCRLCAPECPWEAIYDEAEVPLALQADIELNAQASVGSPEFQVPTARLRRGASPEAVAANKARWLKRA